MTEIGYKEFEDYLTEQKKLPAGDALASVYLIHGEEFLYRSALDALLEALIPAGKRSTSYEQLDGANENIRDAIMRVNTYSLLSGTKIVAVCDSKIFYSKKDDLRLVLQAKEAHRNNDLKSASQHLANLLSFWNLRYEDLGRENRENILKLDPEDSGDELWLDEIIDHCRETGLAIPAATDPSEILQKAVEKGFPPGNRLIITTDLVDKRRALFKAIRQQGVVVDCSVPKGDRRADRAAQEAALKERMRDVLNRSGKGIDRDAYAALYEMTGFDPGTFVQNLEKLISFVGDRKEIGLDDVTSVIDRTKKDPIYELSNAVADRSVEKSLFLVNSLLAADYHPLQILAAIINQVRRLLMAKGFAEDYDGADWHEGVGYGPFKDRIMPAIVNCDQALLDRKASWRAVLGEGPVSGDKGAEKKTTSRQGGETTDLLIAKNPRNPYPVYQLLLKSENYSTRELVAALECLRSADFRLKSTRQRPKLVLEEAAIEICRKAEPS